MSSKDAPLKLKQYRTDLGSTHLSCTEHHVPAAAPGNAVDSCIETSQYPCGQQQFKEILHAAFVIFGDWSTWEFYSGTWEEEGLSTSTAHLIW